MEYETKGIPTINPPPSQVLSDYKAKRDQIVLEAMTAEVKKALAKAESAITTATKINEANKALAKIREAKEELRDPVNLGTLEHLEARIRHFSVE